MIAVLMLAVLAQPYYSAEEAKAVFEQATQAYGRGDFVGAREGFEKLNKHGQGSPDVLFNLGTAALAQGDLGHAVLYLEQARREDPSSEDIEANLAVARSKQVDQVVGQGGGTFLQRFVDGSSATPFAWSFAVFWAAGFVLWIFRRFSNQSRALLGWLAAVFLALAFVPGTALATHIYVRETYREAVVTAERLSAHELPTTTSKTSFEVHAGLKVRVLAEADGFGHIRLPNGLEGWVPGEGLSHLAK
jgi:tetratricopeptide (TPR) repeat protein